MLTPTTRRLARVVGHLRSSTLAITTCPAQQRPAAGVHTPPVGEPSIAELNQHDIKPTEYEEYLFDLRGYVVLKGAISPSHVTELNSALDAMPLDELQPCDW